MAKAAVLPPIGINSSSGQHHSELTGVGGLWTDNKPNAWIQFDLGSIQKVGGVGIAFDNSDTIQYIFSVDISPDGLGYYTMLKGKKSIPKKAGKQIYTFRSVLTRFVRLIIHQNNSPDYNRQSIDVFEVLAGAGKGKAKSTPKAKAKAKVKKKTTAIKKKKYVKSTFVRGRRRH